MQGTPNSVKKYYYYKILITTKSMFVDEKM